MCKFHKMVPEHFVIQAGPNEEEPPPVTEWDKVTDYSELLPLEFVTRVWYKHAVSEMIDIWLTLNQPHYNS